MAERYALVSTSKVALHRPRLVLGWATASEYVTSHLGRINLAISPVDRRSE